MALFELKMPKLGESVTEGIIQSWRVKAGDIVKEDDILLDINTAKVSAEIPSPVAGKVTELLFKEGDTVPVGGTVARIETEAQEAQQVAPSQVQPEQPAEMQPQVQPQQVQAQSQSQMQSETPAQPQTPQPQPEIQPEAGRVVSGDRWYSPAVLTAAREASLSDGELAAIAGTGYQGRVTKKDITDYLAAKAAKGGMMEAQPGTSAPSPQSSQPASVPPAPASPPVSAPEAETGNVSAAVPPAAPATISATGKETGEEAPPAAAPLSVAPEQKKTSLPLAQGDEVKEMDYIRRVTAEHMVMSKKTSAHVTTVVEADVTKLVHWRNRVKDDFKEREGIALTYLPAVVEASAKALKEFPQVNASVDGTKIIFRKHISIGIAVAVENWNLIVPVIHDVDKININGIAREIDSLSEKAHAGKLKVEDVEGGTFTITNFGTFKNLFGAPIINQPQVAVLAVGFIQKKPAVMETPLGDVIVIRHKMYLSLSFDHRIVDGALGGQFLRKIADYLENWDL